MARWHVETEYRDSGLLANVSAYPSREAAWEHVRKSEEQKAQHKEDILFSSLTDTDDSDECPLTRIAILDALDAGYVHHVRPCDGNPDCMACYESGLVG